MAATANNTGLRRAEAKIGGRRVRLLEMDAMDLQFPADCFDKTVLNLLRKPAAPRAGVG